MSGFRAWTVLATLGLLLVVLVPVTRAEPRTSPWQRVRDPAVSAREFLQAFADHKREPRDLEHDTEAMRTQLHRAAAVWLERVAGSILETTTDPELLFLYGECLAYAGPVYLERAERALERALRLGPEHSGAVLAWNTLGRVRAALGRADSAYEAFEHALTLEWDGATRSGILIEQGLLAMGRGQLPRAIERFTAARDGTNQPALWAFAQWALGVAMDRAMLGPEGAVLAWTASQGRFGANGEVDVLALPEFAPEPASEVTYFRALALMGKAQTLPPPARQSALLDAKFLWLMHLREVGPTAPFIARVQHHMAKIDELMATSVDDADLERLARAPMQLQVDAGVLASDMIWPEESTRGGAFWGQDAGVAEPATEP